MNRRTKAWVRAIGIAGGALLLGGGMLLLARRRRGELGLAILAIPPSPFPTPTPPRNELGFAVPPRPEEVGPDSGEIVRDMTGGPDASWIDPRKISLGPILEAVPAGARLLVDVELRTRPEPPAIPGAIEGPCYALAQQILVDDDLRVIDQEQTYPAGCERLVKTPGRDYDVAFPNIKVIKRADGIYVQYTWIRFGHPQHGDIYYARDYKVTLRWSLV